ncbi:MAG TPA: guanylate kinase [Polyangiaceae bacterium]
MDDFLLLILSSPSGAGKTTLKTRILSESHPELRFSVSHTTRKPRQNEVEGREYHFVDRAAFVEMAARDEFAEWAEVHGNLYGTSLREIELARASDRGVVFDIDHQGARQIKAKMPGAVAVFILPPSMKELERRLRSRASDDEQTVKRRLSNARDEIDHYAFFDYLIVNDDLEQAHRKLDAIVIAERARRSRHAEAAERLLRLGQV